LQIASLARYLRAADSALPLTAHAVNVAMQLSTIGLLLLLAASVVLRATSAKGIYVRRMLGRGRARAS